MQAPLSRINRFINNKIEVAEIFKITCENTTNKHN